MEFCFRAGVYRSATLEFVAAIEIAVEDAGDVDHAEELAYGRLQEMVADGFFAGEDLVQL